MKPRNPDRDVLMELESHQTRESPQFTPNVIESPLFPDQRKSMISNQQELMKILSITCLGGFSRALVPYYETLDDEGRCSLQPFGSLPYCRNGHKLQPTIVTLNTLQINLNPRAILW